MDIGDLTGLFAVIGVFSIPVFLFAAVVGIVVISLVFAYRKRKIAHEEIKLAIERGASSEDIERIMKALGADGKRKSDLLGGITILAWGLGLAGFFLFHQQWGIALLLGVPMTVIGAAKIIYWALKGRKKEAEA